MLWEQNPVCCGEQKPVSTQPFAALALDAAEPCSGRASKRSLALPKFCRDLCLMSRPYGLPLVLPLFWLSGSVLRRALGAMPGTQTRRAACGLRPAIGLGLFPRLSGSVSDLGDLGLSLCLALVCMARALDSRKRQYGTWDLFVFITVPLDPIERRVQPF